MPRIRPRRPYPELLKFSGPAGARCRRAAAPGSNNWAVAGTHTRTATALVANDMHLGLGVPGVVSAVACATR